ncbi:MAG: ankyrin repeat domain-containing protein [Wolbachia endosymbiont of Fragariocoptes setiger]|nr:ankyrin repeat domain-containing protein [Wolbachia endosymbiont of Fragariocoptes setiger]
MTESNHRKQHFDSSCESKETTSFSDDFENKTYDEVDTSTNVSFDGFENISIDENGEEKMRLHLAIEEGYDSEKIADLTADVNYQDHEGNTPLHLAIICGNFNVIELLLDKGADSNIRDKKGNTSLHALTQIACRPKEIEATKALKLLVEKAGNISCRDKLNSTPLHYAAKLGNSEVVKLFVENGADINAQNKSGNTPLHYAFDSGHLNIQKYLINKGANTDLQNIDGNTPLDIYNTKHKLEEKILKSISFNNSAQNLNIVTKESDLLSNKGSLKQRSMSHLVSAAICITIAAAYLTNWYIALAVATVSIIIIGRGLVQQPESKLKEINQTPEEGCIIKAQLS